MYATAEQARDSEKSLESESERDWWGDGLSIPNVTFAFPVIDRWIISLLIRTPWSDIIFNRQLYITCLRLPQCVQGGGLSVEVDGVGVLWELLGPGLFNCCHDLGTLAVEMVGESMNTNRILQLRTSSLTVSVIDLNITVS